VAASHAPQAWGLGYGAAEPHGGGSCTLVRSFVGAGSVLLTFAAGAHAVGAPGRAKRGLNLSKAHISTGGESLAGAVFASMATNCLFLREQTGVWKSFDRWNDFQGLGLHQA
jgi:hypothetical protein